MEWMLKTALAHIDHGNLRFTLANGKSLFFGDGTGPLVAVRFTSAAAQWAALLNPDLKLGEAYMDGTSWSNPGRSPISSTWCCRRSSSGRAGSGRSRRCATPGTGRNGLTCDPGPGAMSHTTMISMAGSTPSSSTAIASTAVPISRRRTKALDDAQLAKKRHLAAKLLIGPDQRVLDIGCGWGGLALYIAEHLRRQITGISCRRSSSGWRAAAPRRATFRAAPILRRRLP